MKVLDLFCGAGGASMGYHQAGYDEIWGVDIHPQPNYPFRFMQADAMSVVKCLYLLDFHKFDLIHASPPCQTWSGYRHKHDDLRRTIKPPALIAPVREELVKWGGCYVIENVPGALFEMSAPIQLCGSSFGLDLQRHRLFELSGGVKLQAPACDHSWQLPRFPSSSGRKNLRKTVEIGNWKTDLETQSRAMGIDWMTKKELCQAIPPAYTRWIGERLREHVSVS